MLAAGLKTAGERVAKIFARAGRAAILRETLGLPSTDGVRPAGKKPS